MTHVWLAIDIYPESTTVHVAANRQAALEAIRDDINPHEWESFQDAIRRGGEAGAELVLTDAVGEVVAHYWGESIPAPDVHADAFLVGECWLVHPTTIRKAV